LHQYPKNGSLAIFSSGPPLYGITPTTTHPDVIGITSIGFYNFYEVYNNNRMFDPGFHASIGDDLLYPFHYLARVAQEMGIGISTLDTEPLDTYDTIVFFDFPGMNNKYLKEAIRINPDNLVLFLFENEIIRPDNWKTENYLPFKRVFTWKDTLVDEKRIFKFFLPNRVQKNVSFDVSLKTKFCCMISGNKVLFHPLELYSERIRAVQWFEKNNPDCFDLYGTGWDNPFPALPPRVSGLMKPLFNLLPPNYPSYRGIVTAKSTILKQYKFSICYENARDIPGYITEKIFDCFFSGCVPVYWGAPNITDYIPKGTFIDRRKFGSYAELFEFLKTMSPEKYREYLKSIESFVNGPDIYPFSAENFADTVLYKAVQDADSR
jgi:hypothetical protein